MEEIWKDVDGFPGYQVSNLGNMRSFRDFHGNISNTPHELKLELNKDDYYQICLYTLDHKKVHKRIHRLVLDAFKGPEPNLVANHIDGNKHNNKLENLEYVTAELNSTLASKTGLYKTQPVKILETGEIFDSVKACAEALNVHSATISGVLSGKTKTVKNVHVVRADTDSKKRKPFLYDYQMDAVKRMRNGYVLNGGVGSGKSRTGLFYYFKEQGGWIDESGYIPMKHPKDLYIITTAMKRDKLEWWQELSPFLMSPDPEVNYYDNRIVIDSWNNIKKYANVYGAFFVLDEQRVVGSGAWVKSFLKIAKKNDWILLSATVGDCWNDYIPLFVANGFYKNKTEFQREHIVWSRFTKYPKIDRYINTGRLLRQRNQILVDMDFERDTIPHHEDVFVKYDILKYKELTKTRWNPYTDEPIINAAELCYTWRKIVNSDDSRQVALLEIFERHPRIIVFYNFDYELDILRSLYYGDKVKVAEWNGHKHEPIPECKSWVYLVQYNAGCDGWNCTKTDTTVFFSQNYSYKIMQQAAGRIDRLNTPYTDLYYYHLKSKSPIDIAIGRALTQKKNFNESRFVDW